MTKQRRLEEKKLAWLRKVTALGERLVDLYSLPGFQPNGAGPARIFWRIKLWKVVPDWWPLTVAWRDRWKLTASADYHDLLWHLAKDNDDREIANLNYASCLEAARQEITGPAWLVKIRKRNMLIMKNLYYRAVCALGPLF